MTAEEYIEIMRQAVNSIIDYSDITKQICGG